MPEVWKKTKNKAADFTLWARGLLATSELIATYVYDSREVLTYDDGRICKYPENYPDIVESGKITEEKDSKGKSEYKLSYKGKKFNLALVKEARNRSYFTIDFPVSISNLDEDFFTSFGSTVLGFPKREDLLEYAPIFEVDTSFRLANPSVPCKIEEAKDSHGKSIKDQDGNLKYTLSYKEEKKDKEEEKEEKFDLILVKKVGDKSYFTTDFLLNPKRDNNSKYYDLFKSSIVSLEGRSVFEVDTSCRLTNSSVLGKKGRNGKLLYTAYYVKPDPSKNKTEIDIKINTKCNTNFFAVRDQNNNVEWDKSLISVPIVLASGLAKVFANWLTFIPMKLGEFLIGKKNPIAKTVGYLLFTPAAIVKNSVNMLSTILKAPILLFVANERKYGDKYYTKLKYQLKEYWEKAKSDFKVFKDCARELEQEEKRPNLEFTATWDELNKMKPGIKKDLEEKKNSGGKVADETLKLTPEKGAAETLRLQSSIGDRKAKILEDAGEEIQLLRDAVSRKGINPTETLTKHANGVQSRRNSQTGPEL
ncbi:hypothetical protein [Wolbachia endosymbiont (group E) of Neria commutata]|uniref:hypothetical protein n=1 Tax=Wolbachia endosymbiont (group E) of Neria commutata TaxID=3066149 RepID=UPI003132A9CD